MSRFLATRRCALVATCVACAFGASPLRAQGTDPLAPLHFLEGSWSAKASGAGGASSIGRYAFRRELGGHVLARHSATAGCKGPDDFDCQHGDLLYVFQEAPGAALKALYLDNEGHVIHYAVTTPAPNEVAFVSEPAPGPRFRLTYVLKGTTMEGKFQMQPPGQDAWTSYLEWSGARE